MLPGLVRGMEDHAIQMGSLLLDDAFWLLSALTVIVLAWSGIKTLLNQGELTDVLSDLIHAIIFWGIAAWFLREYRDLMEVFVDTFNALVMRLTQSENAWLAGVSGFFSAANAIFDGMTAMLKGMSWSQIIENWGQLMFSAILYAVAALTLFFAGAVYFVVYAASILLLAIGVAVGPIFIPWVVFEPTRSLFEGWLRYMIQAGLYKVTAAVLGMLVAPVISTNLKTATDYFVATQGTNDPVAGAAFPGILRPDLIGPAMAAALLAVLVVVLMLQAPMIASALAGGKLIASGRLPVPRGPNINSRGGPPPPPPPPGGATGSGGASPASGGRTP